MVKLIDIKNSAGNEWIQFGSKKNDPVLSVFVGTEFESILRNTNYVVGKSYIIDDGKYQYKVSVSKQGLVPVFNLFVKKKTSAPEKVVVAKPQTINNLSLIILAIVVGFIILETVLLIGPILKALGW